MRRQLDVVRLTPSGDLLCLCQAPADTEVDPAEVHQFFLDDLTELPFACKLLADRNRRLHVLTHQAQALHRLGADRVLKEKGVEVCNRAPEADRIGRVEARVDVEAQLDGIAQGLAQCGELSGRFLDRCCRFEDAPELVQAPPYELPTLFNVLLGVLDQLFHGRALHVRIAHDLVAAQAAKQVIDWPIECLPLDIPQRDVDRGDCRRGDVLCRKEATA